ncbi:MAG: hypothetical protein RLZZ04_3346 [Cyanobacteriota bacterium]|jgi:uncharacterized membrane protein YqaE (UPF0057 family)
MKDLTQIIFAIVLPPVGVFLSVGIGSALVINVLLTLLGWLPGVIHALWVINQEAEKSRL